LRVGGPVRDFNFAAKTFLLDGLKVDASTANFVKGSVNDLANNIKVRVVGTFADGKIAATEVSFQRDLGDAQVDVKGEITDFVTSSSFKVRGVPFDASGASIVFTNGDASKLVAGAKVRIRGEVHGDSVKALAIEFITGAVAVISNTVPATTTGTAHASEPVRTVVPSTTVTNTTETATTLVSKSTTFDISGSISSIDLNQKLIRMNGVTFNLPVDRADVLMLESLKNGSLVSLQGSVENGVVVATKVVVTK
jgi:Domain of unknown function (DUF5666)